jgi:hypothetical protein
MRRQAWLIWGLLIGGCSDLSVDQDFDPKFDFGNFKTWSWAERTPQADGPGAADVSSLTHERIRAAIEQELRVKGYSMENPAGADFWVRHHAAIGQRIEVYPGDGWYGDDVRSYDEGTIVVDVLNPKDKRLVWRGTARGAVDPDLTPREQEERIQESVREILAQFPPGR